MTQEAERKPSPIMAMHTRWEQAGAEYDIIDRAATKEAREDGEDDPNVLKLRNALRSNGREADALRVAILRQVPDSWTEAMVLQFHIVNSFDLLANAESGTELEWDTLQTAIDTVFDFMACELPDDHEQIGADFREGAARAFVARRYRTGTAEN